MAWMMKSYRETIVARIATGIYTAVIRGEENLIQEEIYNIDENIYLGMNGMIRESNW